MSLLWQWVSPQASSYSQDAWGGVTHWAISSTFMCDVGSDLCFVPSTHLATVVKPSSPQNFDYKVSVWSLKRWEESAWEQLLAWRGVTPPSTQGIDLGLLLFSQFFGDLCSGLFKRELVCIGWALLGLSSSHCVVKGSSRRATPLKTASSGKEM